MYVFYFFASLIVLQGIFSLRGGFRFLTFVRGEMKRTEDKTYQPFASIIVPCRGLDQGLMMNLRALFNQNYPTYELVFVVDNENDAALKVIVEARDECGSRAPASRIVIAGSADGCGQKVHNLLRAVDEVDARCEVFAFVDSDARPSPAWLRALAAPLKDERVGARPGIVGLCRWAAVSRRICVRCGTLRLLRLWGRTREPTFVGAGRRRCDARCLKI
ncbi:MAG: glycosyltransferase [Pyrinomonadaceae bacterium MAG19_C2-C3]|nr:glycosyltransferase [Pyrinomonadaceae bacterium MAG19_C2-C3]